jgi:glycerate 2-kinase
LLGRCLDAALGAVDGRSVTRSALQACELPRGVPVLALGKAAPAMLTGAADALGARLGPALCICREDSRRPGEPGLPAAMVMCGDHPVPGERSLRAGRELLAFLDALPAGGSLLCLLSGGSSALAEVLPDGLDAARLARANRWLLGSGLPIEDMNAVRAGLSCIKAGRLAQRLAGCQVTVLAISDVPRDDPAVIGSGPWTPAAPRPWPAGLPGWLRAMLESAPAAPRPGAPGLARVDYQVVANGLDAARAAADTARAAGLPAFAHEVPLLGTTASAAETILRGVDAAGPCVHAWFGETSVRLPEDAGAGGRNRHLALALALRLRGRDDVTILCAASDGSDGTGTAAGAWADGSVVTRAAALGLDAAAAFARADAGPLLAATGDDLVTGPTGTNVMDLVLALRGFVPPG